MTRVSKWDIFDDELGPLETFLAHHDAYYRNIDLIRHLLSEREVLARDG